MHTRVQVLGLEHCWIPVMLHDDTKLSNSVLETDKCYELNPTGTNTQDSMSMLLNNSILFNQPVLGPWLIQINYIPPTP